MIPQEFAKKFRLKDFTVASFDYWTVSVRPVQTTLGAMVIALSRACESFGELTGEEGKELAQVFNRAERVSAELTNHERINYLALMMVDHHVHFHVIPRYSGVRQFAEKEFLDAHWPKPPLDLSNGVTDEGTLMELGKALRAKFAALKA